MPRWLPLWLCLSACQTLAPSDTSPNDTCLNPAVAKYPTQALPGKPCAQDADCKYGVCSNHAAVLAGNSDVSVCVASCECGGAGCSADDVEASNLHFTCSRVGTLNQCGVRCHSDADCAAWNPHLCHCVGEVPGYVQGGTYKVCVRGSDCPAK